MQQAEMSTPYLKIVEQPAAKACRFRYECEGRCGVPIPGVNSTPDNKTYPTIEIVNYDKDVFVVVSCVTKDSPYRPHPNKVVGRDGTGQRYINGICEVELKGNSLRAVFSNLGIQYVKKKDVPASLALRQERSINPFNVPYNENVNFSYDFYSVRLCFQAFINPTGDCMQALEPQLSDPIYDKRFSPVICRLSSSSGTPNGGDIKLLFCRNVNENDFKIKFTELNNEGEIIWTAYADIIELDVRRRTTIAFQTPRYQNTNISDPVMVYVQLERLSENFLCPSVEFKYIPD